MEKKEFITISVEEYKALRSLQAEKEIDEEVAYKKEIEEQRYALAEKMFELCKEIDDPCELANDIITEDAALVTEVFDNYSPLETSGALMDFIEGYDYYDPITNVAHSLRDWCDFFHNPEDNNTVEELYDRCKELYNQKNEIIKQTKALIDELLK